MFDLFRDLSVWVLGFADSDWSLLVLAVTSFFESIFFPIPPDALLIAIGVRNPETAVWLAALVTGSSVAGAVVGHWLGGRFGRPLLYRLVRPSRVERVEVLFNKYGAWAVVLAAFTPIPYKVFAISAGILDLDRRTFILASLVGRGARFFTLGILLLVFGESIGEFIDDNFELITVATAAALLVGVGVVVLIIRLRRADDAVS